VSRPDLILSIGAACFGLVAGYITYRTLARSTRNAQISDLAAVLGAIGGGAVTALFHDANSYGFAFYAMGLLVGMIVYGGLYTLINGRRKFGEVLHGGEDPTPR
jgi:O-antigen/teichoic acid export membrane protein